MTPASLKTPHIIRLRPVTLVQLDENTSDQHRFAVVSRDEQHIQVLHIHGDLDPSMFDAFAQIGAEWLLQAIANRLHTNYRVRKLLARE